jgi:hypothetical protein
LLLLIAFGAYLMALDPWSYAKTSEHSHQAALLMWANMAVYWGLNAADFKESYSVKGYAEMVHKEHLEQFGKDDRIPQLKWLHAIHNQGHGDAIRGGKAKAEGVKAGVYDLFLPVPKAFTPQAGMYHGLYLEMKVGSNQPSDKQNEFAADMRAAGYATEVAWSWLEAREKILAYLSI